MERKVNYEAFDGRTFEMKSDCYAYEEALRETYNKIIENIEFYNNNYEKVEPMSIEMFYAREDMPYEMGEQLDNFVDNISIVKINKDYFDFCRKELNNWSERTRYFLPVSPKKSKYDYYIFTTKNFDYSFIPFDDKIEEASAIVKLVLKGKLL